eukprot:12472417-Heterocapsa_arctica.AAC.1
MRGRAGEHQGRAIAYAMAHLYGQRVPSASFGRPAVQQAAHARRHRWQRDSADSFLPSSPLHSSSQEF